MSSSAKLPLHFKVLMGLVLGAIVGGICQAANVRNLDFIVDNFAKPMGAIFLNMIFMVVVPLLFAALVLGVSELGDATKIGKVGLRCLMMTILLSGIAVGIGVVAVNIVKPGAGFSTDEVLKLQESIGKKADAAKSVEKSKEAKTAADTIVEMIPKNPLESATKALEGGLLPFMVFALIFGIALSGIPPEKALPVKEFLEGLLAVTLRIIDMGMKLAPYGVFGLVFAISAKLGITAFVALGKYVILVMVCLAFHQFVVYSMALKYIAKRDPRTFFRQIRGVMLTAFATSSSNATLPTALKAAEEEVGLPRNVSNFVLTVGATANQNGTALFEGITILFLAQLFHVDLSIGQQFMVMGLAILAGVGTAGVPGGAWPMIAIILVKIDVPAEAIGICLGVDRILDMSRTVLNVTGDITIAACVAQMEPKAATPQVAAG
ncbi:MAG: dicarboxylate/amino acid:cation symporter [Armatimonadetes bacterium]|nr:dicarboxylate/amino acid:cation symporter [Armatimonadota bacterium]